jgi:hypothetical protein
MRMNNNRMEGLDSIPMSFVEVFFPHELSLWRVEAFWLFVFRHS